MKRVVIDLASYQEPIKVMLDKSVSDFSREHPDRAVSMLMLSYTGYNPLLVVAVDTPQHSDKHIEEFSSTLFKEFPDFAGRDEHGAFCINASDCEFEIGHFRFQGFPDMYGIGPFSLRYPNGDIVPIDITNRGDVAMDDAMFKFLLPVMEKFNGWRTLKRAPIFRLGIQTEDRSYSKFWRPLE